MNRRTFLSMLAIPAAGLVPLPSGRVPTVFHGVKIERSGIFMVNVTIDGLGPDDCRLMLDEVELLRAWSPAPTRAILRATFVGRTGQLLHLDLSAGAEVSIRVDRIGGGIIQGGG